jgi:hypothetical protein
MRNFWLILCASAGCTFGSPGGSGSEPGPGDGDDDIVDPGPGPGPGPGPAGRTACDSADPSLRLCVDFDGAVIDLSATGAPIAATAVAELERDGDPAAALTGSSTMHVREAATLDIQGALALDAWVRPVNTPDGQGYWILDNNQQYGASVTDAGKVRCIIGSRSLDSSAALPNDGVFHHVACTYDRAKLKVFIDGDVARCVDASAEIPTNGIDGLAIGANLSGTDLTPEFTGRFLGGLDDVRVWARADLDVCAAAGRTGCQTTCPGV